MYRPNDVGRQHPQRCSQGDDDHQPLTEVEISQSHAQNVRAASACPGGILPAGPIGRFAMGETQTVAEALTPVVGPS
jgi:hypothetical protein